MVCITTEDDDRETATAVSDPGQHVEGSIRKKIC